MTETTLLRQVRLALQRQGITTFRNNTGVAVYKDGRRVRYGLCKGSSDLVGWKSYTQPNALHSRLRTTAIFVAVEVKVWPKKPTKDQRRFLNAVFAAGGWAAVAYGPDDVRWLDKPLT
jgi:hypothetical protein